MIASAPSYTLGSLPEYPPTRAGYAFKGWYADATDVSIITPDSTISGNTTVYGRWKLLDNAQLRIDTHPQGKNYNPNAPATALFVRASVIGGGTLSYQWYSSTSHSSSGGTAITGATGESWTPPTAVMGTFYYYVVVTNTNNEVNGEKTASVVSTTARIIVDNFVHAASPVITVQPQGATYDYNTTAAPLSVTATSPDGGTLSYRWYENGNTSNAVGYDETYTPPTTTLGTFNYYVVVTNTNNAVDGETTASTTSATATIVVNPPVIPAAIPRIYTHPQGASYNPGAAATPLSVSASVTDSGALSYQWYSNTADSNSGGTAITGATGESWTPPTASEGILYYYVVVTNTNNAVNGVKTATATSTVAAIVVNTLVNAASPVISVQPQSANYAYRAAATPLSVTAAAPDGGTLSYRWYESGNTVGYNATYTPRTTTAGTFNYYVVVTNTNNAVNGETTASTTSATAVIVVTDKRALNTAINNAQTALAAVWSGTPGASTPNGTRYDLTGAAITNYQSAIAVAQGVYVDGGATVAAIAQALTDLATATNTFNLALQTWTVGTAALDTAIQSLQSWLNGLTIADTASQVRLGFHYLATSQKTDLQNIINTARAVRNSAARTGAEVTAQESLLAAADTEYKGYYNGQTGTYWPVTTSGNVITADSSATAGEVKAALTAYLASVSGGGSPASPVVVKINVTSASQLTDGNDDIAVLYMANTDLKYVSYDLSDSALTSIRGYYPERAPYKSKVVSITLPNSLVTIGNYLFYGFSGLTSLTIPDSVDSIANDVFNGCTSLTSVTIGSGVTSIGNEAFNGCSSLTSVTIPDSVTSIGTNAFYRCSSLTSVTIGSGITSIGNSGLLSSSVLTSITVDNGNANYKSIDGVLFNKAGNTLLQYPAGRTGAYTIPNGVTSITSAFAGCSGLTSLTIPNSVTSIDTRAFNGCTGLTSVTIPDSVTSIGGNAFRGCTSLTSVTIPDSVTSISGSAFRDCSSLTSIIMRPSPPPTLGGNVFLNTPASFRIKVASALLATYQGTTVAGWTAAYKALVEAE
jgi:uncharacterized repeat protein (TIGR02543 family)